MEYELERVLMSPVPAVAELGNGLALAFIVKVLAKIGPWEEIAARVEEILVELGREVVDEDPPSVARS